MAASIVTSKRPCGIEVSKSAIDAKLTADAAAAAREEPLSMKIEFVMPIADHICGDQD
jgi:hypothetical protein